MEVGEGCVVTLEYTVHLANGELLDSTGHCGPISIVYGSGQLFDALERRIAGMQPGETRRIRIPAEEAYGPSIPELVRMMPRDRLPPDLVFEVGSTYKVKSPDGKTLRFRVLEVGDTEVKADFNSPNAGQDLLAAVTVVSVAAPSE
jgi:peptidylprolyl isomerase